MYIQPEKLEWDGVADERQEHEGHGLRPTDGQHQRWYRQETMSRARDS